MDIVFILVIARLYAVSRRIAWAISRLCREPCVACGQTSRNRIAQIRAAAMRASTP